MRRIFKRRRIEIFLKTYSVLIYFLRPTDDELNLKNMINSVMEIFI